jgi:hypothetical protein
MAKIIQAKGSDLGSLQGPIMRIVDFEHRQIDILLVRKQETAFAPAMRTRRISVALEVRLIRLLEAFVFPNGFNKYLCER